MYKRSDGKKNTVYSGGKRRESTGGNVGGEHVHQLHNGAGGVWLKMGAGVAGHGQHQRENGAANNSVYFPEFYCMNYGRLAVDCVVERSVVELTACVRQCVCACVRIPI